ncbi:MAG: WD40 repeat domain-containing protein [Planctomycetes bacterium]|nr:WD40 repeat domain-containing protein [Planctomycetota bacterium]
MQRSRILVAFFVVASSTIAGASAGSWSEYRGCAVSASGRWEAASLRDGGVELRDTEHCRSRLLEPRSKTYFHVLCFSPDESMLVGADHGGTIVRWDLDFGWNLPGKQLRKSADEGEPEAAGRKQRGNKTSWYLGPRISVSPDGCRIFAAWEDGTRELYSRGGRLVAEFRDQPTAPEPDEQGWVSLGGWFDARDVAWSSDSSDMLLRLGSTVSVFDALSGQPRLREDEPIKIEVEGVVHSCALNSDASRIAIGYGNMYVGLFDFRTSEKLVEYRYTDPFFLDKEAAVHQLAFSPTGDRLAFTSSGGAYVGVLDSTTLEELYDSDFRGGHFGEILRLTWLADGDAIAYWFDCGADGVELLDLREAPRRLGHRNLVWPSFSSGGVVAIKTDDGSLEALSFDELFERGEFIPEVEGIEKDD